MQRLPRRLPLSRLNGAKPAKAAICLRLSAPNSGRCAIRMLDSTLPTPGTERSNSSRSRHRGGEIEWIETWRDPYVRAMEFEMARTEPFVGAKLVVAQVGCSYAR